jgi:hypothetical protein
VSGGGSPELPGIRKNKPMESHKHYDAAFPSRLGFLLLPSSRRGIFEGMCFHPLCIFQLCSLVSMKKKPKSRAYLVMKNKPKASKIDMRTRLIYVCDFAYLVMKNKPTEVYLLYLV